jgi:hypothetical protein
MADTNADVPTPPSEHIPDEAKEQEPDAEEHAKEVCPSDPHLIVLPSTVWVLTGVQSWRRRGSSPFLPRRDVVERRIADRRTGNKEAKAGEAVLEFSQWKHAIASASSTFEAIHAGTDACSKYETISV